MGRVNNGVKLWRCLEMRKKRIKFGPGTAVSHSGFHGVVSHAVNKTQRHVRLNRGAVVVDVSDLKYWKKKK